jgi:spore germination protein GerM
VTRKRILGLGATFAAGALAIWALFTFFPAEQPASTADQATAAAATAETPVAQPQEGRKIKARIFYVGDQGTRLVGVDQEVPFAEGREQQAREIVAAEIAPPPEGQVSPIPAGTAVRAVFVTDNGEAYVDFTRPISDAHPGGTTSELLTVYAIVNALTTNLPAITSVQILVDGREVDTLAGHVDLRQPLAQNLDWVQ